MLADVHNPLALLEKTQHMRHQRGAVGVAENDVGVRHKGGYFREGLRHAARQHQSGGGAGAPHAVHGLAHLVIAGRRHGAGVDDHDVASLRVIRYGEAGLLHAREHHLRLILIDLTAERYGKNLHAKKTPSVAAFLPLRPCIVFRRGGENKIVQNQAVS